jgi:hypothetical protein
LLLLKHLDHQILVSVFKSGNSWIRSRINWWNPRIKGVGIIGKYHRSQLMLILYAQLDEHFHFRLSSLAHVGSVGGSVLIATIWTA